MVLFVVGFVGLYIPYQQTSEILNVSPIPTTTEASVIISYTNSGFEPQTITIRASTTVEWVNTSDKLMWVASDPHPSHTNLPGFDERGVQGNDAVRSTIPIAYAHTHANPYKYTFLKAGKWSYHNHLVPNDRGIVIVEE